MLKKKTRRSVRKAGRANTESLETAPGQQRYPYNQQAPKHQSFSTKGPTVLTNHTGDQSKVQKTMGFILLITISFQPILLKRES